MPPRSACARKSGPESTNTAIPPALTKIDARNRRFRGSAERQTAHLHPITGTPTEVPVPRNVIENSATNGIMHISAHRSTLEITNVRISKIQDFNIPNRKKIEILVDG